MEAQNSRPMGTPNRIRERRQYSRLPAAQAGFSRVEMQLRSHQRCRARLVDVSAGGLLCRLPGAGPLPNLHESLDTIHLFRDRREPLSFTGTVRRLDLADGQMLCAVEFAAALPVLGAELDLQGRLEPPAAVAHDPEMHPALCIGAEDFLGRLLTAPALPRSRHDEETPVGAAVAQWRRSVASTFQDVLQNLTEAERWWFFHIVDKLKNEEPDYTELLVAEYVRLCKKGIAAEPGHGAA